MTSVNTLVIEQQHPKRDLVHHQPRKETVVHLRSDAKKYESAEKLMDDEIDEIKGSVNGLDPNSNTDHGQYRDLYTEMALENQAIKDLLGKL